MKLAARSAVLVLLAVVAGCQEEKPPAPKPAPASITPSAVDLMTARKGFQTHLTAKEGPKDPPPPVPPKDVFEVVRYTSDVGQLTAYLTPDPKDGKKHPAIVWAHSGFGGIGEPAWVSGPPAKDLSVNAFRTAGIVTMVPAWRGESGNPGRFELFYGEVNDLLAAVDYVSKLPYVDPQRVYVGGHSTGGTLALLAATASDKFRAVFSFGGAPNVERIVANGKGYGNTPFDYHNAEEGRLRSATYFTSFIKRPTFYFEGARAPTYLGDVGMMAQAAAQAKVPFTAFKIPGHDHFDILAPLTKLVAAKINADTGPTSAIEFTAADLDGALAVAAPKPASAPAPAAPARH